MRPAGAKACVNHLGNTAFAPAGRIHRRCIYSGRCPELRACCPFRPFPLFNRLKKLHRLFIPLTRSGSSPTLGEQPHPACPNAENQRNNTHRTGLATNRPSSEKPSGRGCPPKVGGRAKRRGYEQTRNLSKKIKHPFDPPQNGVCRRSRTASALPQSPTDGTNRQSRHHRPH